MAMVHSQTHPNAKHTFTYPGREPNSEPSDLKAHILNPRPWQPLIDSNRFLGVYTQTYITQITTPHRSQIFKKI